LGALEEVLDGRKHTAVTREVLKLTEVTDREDTNDLMLRVC